MKKMFIFDMDGVILDSMPYLQELAIQVMMSTHSSARGFAEKEYRRTVGHPFRQQLEMISPNNSRNDSAAQVYLGAHYAFAPLLPLAPLVQKVLATARIEGVLLALVSSTPRTILLRTQVMILPFTYISGWDKEMPKLIQIKHCLSDAWIDPHEAIYFGDSPVDKDIAQEVRCNFVHIPEPNYLAIRVGVALNRGDNDGSLAPV